ncbi:hypothetical protein P8452_27800 [Trifolium repens]|nr:hypothetical protein P8452_27800 [Trifolium repens]
MCLQRATPTSTRATRRDRKKQLACHASPTRATQLQRRNGILFCLMACHAKPNACHAKASRSERERERERRNSLRLRLSRNRLQPPTRSPHSKSSVATIEIVRRHIEIARRFSSVKHSRRFHSFDFKSLFGFPSLNFASTEENLTPTVERCYNPNCNFDLFPSLNNVSSLGFLIRWSSSCCIITGSVCNITDETPLLYNLVFGEGAPLLKKIISNLILLLLQLCLVLGNIQTTRVIKIDHETLVKAINSKTLRLYLSLLRLFAEGFQYAFHGNHLQRQSCFYETLKSVCLLQNVLLLVFL